MSNLTSSNRLIALDALRGFTIVLMVIVNSPGSWGAIYAPLQHATWNGATPTDLVFPFFLFFVGVSIALAYTNQINNEIPKTRMAKKILIRSAKIYGLGLLLSFWHKIRFYPDLEFTFSGIDSIRWVGVLARISFVFLACGLLFLNTNWKQQIKIAAAILIGYWVLMVFIPVPGIGFPDLSEAGKNWANYLDQLLLPGRLWQKTWDPEGILSTLPAIASGITGMLAGTLIIKEKDVNAKLVKLFFMGFTMFLVGHGWNWFFPINKHIWTSSYVMYTSGLASMGLASCILIIDVWGKTKWTFIGRVYGANAIVSYALSGMLISLFYSNKFIGVALNQVFMEKMIAIGVADKMASLMYAVMYMLVIFIPALIMYRKKIFVRV